MSNYPGNKSKYFNKIWNDILENLQQENIDIDENTYCVDLFCGGCNFISNVPLKNRIANDISKPLIEYFKKNIQDTQWLLEYDLQNITREEYEYIKNNQTKFSPQFRYYVGIGLSFNTIFFQGVGFNEDTPVKSLNQRAYKHAIKDSKKLKNVQFFNLDYRDVPIPPKSIVYCDIPYKGTNTYTNKKNDTDKLEKEPFDYDAFYKYAEKLSDEGHYVYISEMNSKMPKRIVEISNFTRNNVMANASRKKKK